MEVEDGICAFVPLDVLRESLNREKKLRDSVFLKKWK